MEQEKAARDGGGGESLLTVLLALGANFGVTIAKVVAGVMTGSAALVGLSLAFAGLGLTDLTGSLVWDGIASLLIGVLLVVVAYVLGRSNMRLLVGHQADPRLVAAIRERLNGQPEVEIVVDLLTMLVGTDQVLVCARLDFIDGIESDELERACVRIDTELRAEFPDLDEIFLEPVPRSAPDLRARVVARYGTRQGTQQNS